MSATIPASFDEWRHCIEHDCGIPLTVFFIDQRLMAWRASQSEEVQRFVRLYGLSHWQRVVHWFEQARRDVSR